MNKLETINSEYNKSQINNHVSSSRCPVIKAAVSLKEAMSDWNEKAITRLSKDLKKFELKTKSWNAAALTVLNKWDDDLETQLPNFAIQNKIDKIGNLIAKHFAALDPFNKWLDDNGHGSWPEQLAIFLAKLPMRAARNVVQLLYEIIKNILHSAVHPLKSLNHLAKLMVALATALTEPETWSRAGIGIIGTHLGQSVITGNPLSVISVGIGAALALSGLSLGTLKTAIIAQKGNRGQAVKQYISQMAKELPETALTALCIGFLLGGIQRILFRSQLKNHRISNIEEAKRHADEFIKKHNLPSPRSVYLNNGKIVMRWSPEQMKAFSPTYQGLFPKEEVSQLPYTVHNYFDIELTPFPSGVKSWLSMHEYDGFEGYSFSQPISTEHFGITKNNSIFSQYGSAIGAFVNPSDHVRKRP